MTKRTPIDGTSNSDAQRRKDRLKDPEDSDVFDPAIAPDHWTCAAVSVAAGKRYLCGRHDQHDPDPQQTGHHWYEPGGKGNQADPTPPPSAGHNALESTATVSSAAEAAGSGDGSGRPQTTLKVEGDPLTEEQARGIKAAMSKPASHRSIGRPIANTAFDAATGVPDEVQDERAHAREATEILLEAAADQYRYDQLMPYARLLDLHAVVEHMVEARRVIR